MLTYFWYYFEHAYSYFYFIHIWNHEHQLTTVVYTRWIEYSDKDKDIKFPEFKTPEQCSVQGRLDGVYP